MEIIMETIKKITFPPSEIETIKKQDRIITTRVSADYDKFHEGDLVETPWKVIYKVAKRLEITSIEKHPHYSELTKQQIAYLSKQDKIAVLTLEKQFDRLELAKVKNSSSDELSLILEGINLAADASNDPKWTMQDLEKYLEVKPNIFFIKKEEEKIGIVFLGIDGGHNEIGNFAIFKKYQGKGYGLQALKVIIDYLRKLHPGKDIEIGVAEKNIKAVNLYKKVGFKITKTGEEKSGRFYRMSLDAKTSVSMEDLSGKVASNIVNDKVYHASPKKFDVISGKKSNTPNAKSSVFVSPFKHFASMFILDFQCIVDQIEEQIGKKHIKIDNFGFMEWNETPRSTTSIPSKVHVLVRTPENFKPFKGKATGYMYTIDFSKYKDQANMWSKAKDSDVEFTIHGDVKPEKCEQISYEYEVLKDTKQYNHAEESMDEFASEAMQDTISVKKMYFADNNGKIPKDKKQNPVLVQSVEDAKIYFGFNNFWDESKPIYYRGITKVNGVDHLLFVHGDASETNSVVRTVSGTIYEIEFDEPVEFRLHGNRGFGCKKPKIYTAKENVLQTGKIRKNTEEETVVPVVYSFNKSLVNHSTEEFSQENFGAKDDAFVKDVIRPKIRDGILYHGSANKHVPIKAFQLKELRDKKIKTISLTPYKRLASLFCVPFRSIRENEKGQVIFHHAAFKLDEWFVDIPEDDKYKAVQTVHISHNIKELAPSDKVYTGYLHYVDAEDALEDAGRNPINDKGPNEVVCFKSELKPFKVEQIHVRMISRYSSSFAKEVGHDAESCEPEDIASEEFKLDFSVPIKEEFSMEEAIDLLSEFNEGCKAFEDWCNRLEASLIYKSTDDAGVKQVCFSIAQENILNDLVKDIFKKIGEFIRWFWSKLVQLWNFFFGKVQRAQRAFKSNHDKIKAHKNSNKLFNDKAFSAMPSPMGITIADVYLDFLDAYWDPDKCYPAFEAIFNAYEKDPRDLIDLMNDNTATSPLFQMYHAVGYGIVANTADEAKETAFSKLVKAYPAKGTLKEAGYTDGEIVEVLSDMMTHVIESYAKTSKLINSKGNIGAVAAKKMLDYADRTDLTEQEANQMAAKVNAAASCIKVVVQKFNDSYYQLLSQTLKLQECYMKCMQ